MLWVVVITVGALLLAVVVIALTKPNQLQLTRSIQVTAGPDRVFELINDLHAWQRWHPQQVGKPAPELGFSGAASGVGAVCVWRGRGNVGEGRMLITQAVVPTHVRVEVDWRKPFVTHNVNDFTVAPAAAGASVTWSMSGPNLLPMKVMSVFINMDRMMGRHFEEGLAALKKAAESQT
jgi:uncharacterized protein YndB with AHSA1/START domain